MDKLLTTALQAAEAAALIQRRSFRRVDVEAASEKGKSDFVTRVDTEAQEAALAVIRSAFPEHHILAEEEETDRPGGRAKEEEETEGPGGRAKEEGDGSGEKVDGAGEVVEGEAARAGSAQGTGAGGLIRERSWPRDGGFLWIVDPLDGTTNYLHGHPMFGASVGVGRDGVMEAGAVVAPALADRWWARRGEGAWKNGDPIRVSALGALRKALVGTGFPFKAPHLVSRYVEELGRVLQASGGVRRGGSAALDFCYLAEGILDAFWEEDYLSPWDAAAGMVILAEAGGVVTRLDGSPLDLEDGSYLAANSPELLEALRRVVQGSKG